MLMHRSTASIFFFLLELAKGTLLMAELEGSTPEHKKVSITSIHPLAGKCCELCKK